MEFTRAIQLPDKTAKSFFLWGPRKTGKSYLLRSRYPTTPIVDLLRTDELADYMARPALLRERYEAGTFGSSQQIIIDEVQKVPQLLDEVHWLIENRGVQFILTGSSARKLKRGKANLLGGRAWRRELHPLTIHELSQSTNHLQLETIFSSGLLPSHVDSTDYNEDLRSYVGDYLKEEILDEALVQNFPAFSQFLQMAALSNGELLNYTNIAREVGVSAKVVKGYVEILYDTLLAYRLYPWQKKESRRLVRSEKFFLFDVGVANYLAKRRPMAGTPEFGKSFEHLIFLELMAYRSYRDPELSLSFWRTDSGVEVDFIVNDRQVLIEVKSSTSVHETDLKGLSQCAEEGSFGRRILVCREGYPRILEDRLGNVLVLPFEEFVQRLWAGEVLTLGST
jgi:predicted AAA+ superfamily ATPase